MRRLAVLAVVAGALVATDVASRGWAEFRLREEAVAYYPPSAAASASIRSFPFLGRLLVLGEVPGVSFDMENVRAEAVVLESLHLDLTDVEIDRGELLRGRVRVVDVGRGRLSARIDGSSLARAAGVDLRFGDGEIEIHRRVAGVDIFATARASLEGNTVRLQPTSVQGVGVPIDTFALTYEIPGVELVPCWAEARALPGGLEVACTFEDVPPALIRIAGGGTRPGGGPAGR